MLTAAPTLRVEKRMWRAGELVCGIDEVGRGAWAGPVTVGAVIPSEKRIAGVRDSKQLSHAQREKVAAKIWKWARAIGIGYASHEECDELGMTLALRYAAERALKQIREAGFEPDHILLDGQHNYLREKASVTTIVKGDTSSLAIAAASVVAKVARDHLMVEESEHFPLYGFESNRGYPAPVHQAALAAYGPCSIHRRSWVFMEGLCWGGLPPAPGRLL